MQHPTIGIDTAKDVFHVLADGSGGARCGATSCGQPSLAGVSGVVWWRAPWWNLRARGMRLSRSPRSSSSATGMGTRTTTTIALRRIAPDGAFGGVGEQQELQALQRTRSLVRGDRNALAILRGMLAEFGVVVARSLGAFRRRIPEILEDGDNELTDGMRLLVRGV